VIADEPARVDPALAGRDLGPWFMLPWWISIPLAVLLAVALVWYFMRLGRPGVPRGRRWLRRASVVLALAGLAPLVRALTFAHPHEDRLAFAVAWSTVLFVIVACLFLAVIDVIIVTRGGMREYRALRRETLGGRRSGEHEEPGNG
jgi:hypothetical protein